eukprot:6404515-Pyramimonas_sp.AAC.1
MLSSERWTTYSSPAHSSTAEITCQGYPPVRRKRGPWGRIGQSETDTCPLGSMRALKCAEIG